MKNEKFEIVVKTLQGLEEVLADEIGKIGGVKINILKRAVSFEGDKELLYKANLCLRTALKVLKPIHKFRVYNQDSLGKGIDQIDWGLYLNISDTFVIDAVVNSNSFNHSGFVALKSKDAIADQFRKKTGKRPSVDNENPTLRINVHIQNNDCTVLLDSSNDSLFKRGYRVNTSEAPLNEILAAGLVLLSGWKADCNLIDPMCGSGTILIEAAMFALNISPNILRKQFGFMKWVDFDNDLWKKVIADSKQQERKFDHQIIGSDIDSKAFKLALENIKNAHLQDTVSLVNIPIEYYEPPAESGILITNPPYGERLKSDDIDDLYDLIGQRLKHQFTGYDAWILSSNVEALKHIGLKPSKKINLINGSLDCKFIKYSLYKGSKKIHKTQEDTVL